MSSREQLEEILTITQKIFSSLDCDEILHRVVEEAAVLTSSDVCLLVLAEGEGTGRKGEGTGRKGEGTGRKGEGTGRKGEGTGRKGEDTGRKGEDTGRIVAHVGLDSQNLQEVVVPLGDGLQQALAQVLPEAEKRRFLSVPLNGLSEVNGVLACWPRGEAPANTQDRLCLGLLADQAAIAIEHAFHHRALMSGRDRQSRLLRAILENTPDQLALLDGQLRFLEANAAFCAKSGCARDTLLGRRFAEVDARPERLALLQRVVATGTAVEQRELPRQDPAGTSYWSFSARPISDMAGQVEGVVLSELEVTQLVTSRLEREQNARELAEINEAKDSFLYSIHPPL